jgi:chromosome partitioning protein
MAATKGGVCKTTLVECLAVQAAKAGDKVAMVDLDPQCSLSQWWQLRGKPDNPKLFTNPTDLAGDMRRLKKAGWQFVFLDTPPGNVDIVEDAIATADLAIIPTRVSAEDVLAVEPAIDACKAAGVPFAFVLTAYDTNWKLSASAGPYLSRHGPVLEPPMRYRAAYAAAKTLGRTGPESQDSRAAKACREEIAALWDAIRALVR